MKALFPRRDALRRGGFTLVEVIIALAIFVFGAVAIIRIFPPALGVIQNSGDKLTALNLNRTTLAGFAKDSSAVPDAVHEVYFGAEPVASAVVGSAIRNNSLPKRGVQNIDDSALDHFKYITGERQKVRRTFVEVTGNPVPVPIDYVLTSYPIADGDEVGTPTQYTPAAKIYKETNVAGVVAKTETTPRRSGLLDFTESSPTLVALSSMNAADDLENFYYASYSYLEQGRLNSTTDEVVRLQTPTAVPAVYININNDAQLLQGRRLDPSFLANGSRVIDGPIKLKFRQRLELPATRTFSFDEEVSKTLNNLGILVLSGSTYRSATNPTVLIAPGDEVSVDYRTRSWSQIVQNGVPTITPEVDPPSPALAPINRTSRELVLPIRALSDGADGTTPAPAIYSFISYVREFPTIPNPTRESTLQANRLDVSDNLAVLQPTNPLDEPAKLMENNPFFLWSANRKGGRVVFDIKDQTSSADYQILQSRVVYQNLDNWTHQLSVAPTTYTPYYNAELNNRNTNGDFAGDPNLPNDPSAPRNVNVAQPWRYYSWTPGLGDQSGRIFFPPSEAGKTISLSYTYLDGTVEKEVNNGVVTINTNWIRESDAPANAGTGLTANRPRDLAVADNSVPSVSWLAYAEPQINGSSNRPIVAIRSIRGVSVQARTAWLDGSNFNQVSTGGFRGGSN